MTKPATRPVALVTGVSRRSGIGAAVARRLAPDHDLLLTGLPSYDESKPHGGDPDGPVALMTELRGLGARVQHIAADLRDSSTPRRLVTSAKAAYGRLDALVAVHTYSSETSLHSMTGEQIDVHLSVNVRGTLLLVQAFAREFDESRGGGRIVLFTSGQRLGPMPDELAYVASKGALEAVTGSLAHALAPRGVTVNAVNPGPTDTGYAKGERWERVRARFPAGRWGEPDDAARLVAWLCSEDGRWVTGQVIDSEGGFNRY